MDAKSIATEANEESSIIQQIANMFDDQLMRRLQYDYYGTGTYTGGDGDGEDGEDGDDDDDGDSGSASGESGDSASGSDDDDDDDDGEDGEDGATYGAGTYNYYGGYYGFNPAAQDEHIVDTEHIKTAKELEDAKDHSSDLYVVIGVLSLIIGIMLLVILGCAYHVYNQSKPGLNKVATTDMAEVAIPMDTMGQTNIVHEDDPSAFMVSR